MSDKEEAFNNIGPRKDMIDDALMRPGRLEVQIEIGLPKESGRIQVTVLLLNFFIHA